MVDIGNFYLVSSNLRSLISVSCKIGKKRQDTLQVTNLNAAKVLLECELSPHVPALGKKLKYSFWPMTLLSNLLSPLTTLNNFESALHRNECLKIQKSKPYLLSYSVIINSCYKETCASIYISKNVKLSFEFNVKPLKLLYRLLCGFGTTLHSNTYVFSALNIMKYYNIRKVLQSRSRWNLNSEYNVQL